MPLDRWGSRPQAIAKAEKDGGIDYSEEDGQRAGGKARRSLGTG